MGMVCCFVMQKQFVGRRRFDLSSLLHLCGGTKTTEIDKNNNNNNNKLNERNKTANHKHVKNRRNLRPKCMADIKEHPMLR